MNDNVSFGDIINQTVADQFSNTLSPLNVLVTLLLALAIGLFIYFIYRKTFSGVLYSRNFGLSLPV